MPFKVTVNDVIPAQNALDTAADIVDDAADQAVNPGIDMSQTTASYVKSSAVSQTSSAASQQTSKTEVKSGRNKSAGVASSSPTAASVNDQIRAGSSPAASVVKGAARETIKSITTAVSLPGKTDKTAIFGRSGSGRSALSAGISTVSTASLQQSASSVVASATDAFFSQTRSPTWAVNALPATTAPIIEASPEDQSYKYGLFLLKPEIITLFDSDPLFEDDQKTSAYEFLSMQFSTAKVVQESSYRRTRKILSSLSYIPSIGFNERDLLPIEPVNAIERQGTSLFEQAVSKWDADYTRTLSFCNTATERSQVAQNIVSALDIVNIPPSSIGYADLREIAQLAAQTVDALPTSYRAQLSGDFPLGVSVSAEFDRHNYNRATSDGESFITDLIKDYSTISASYRSYSLMHALLQQSFISFAFGSVRDSTMSRIVVRSRDTSDPQSSFKYSIRTEPLGQLTEKKILYSPQSYGQDTVSLSSAVPAADVSKSILLRLCGIAAFNSSNIATGDTALDAFSASVGLPIGLANGSQGTGNAISDFEIAEAGSSTNLLFQIPASTSQKLMYFDRSHNPGLPSGYTHGYSRIFGDTTSAQSAASDLASRMNSALLLHSSLDKGLLALDVAVSGKTYKAADLSLVALQKFASLLEMQWEGQSIASSYSENERKGFRTAFESYLATSGTQTSVTKTAQLKVSSKFEDPFGIFSVPTDKLPIDADFEILRFLSLRYTYTGDLVAWAQSTANLMMTYWSERFDYVTGVTATRPTKIGNLIYDAETINTTSNLEYFSASTSEDILKRDIRSYYGDVTYLTQLETYVEGSMDRLVDWAISAAQSILSSASSVGPATSGTRSGSTAIPVYKSVLPVFDPSDAIAAAAGLRTATTYDLKEICLLLTAFAAHCSHALFDDPATPSSEGQALPYTRYRNDAGATLDEIVSFVPISFDDARLCLSTINAQLSTAITGLTRVVEGDLLQEGKFNPVYTPCQAASSAIRMYEFLGRRSQSPFHSARYDETSVVRSLERSAVNALYRSDLMRLNDTRTMFIGLPVGLQHVVGLGQRYAKVTVTRRDQTNIDKTFSTVSFVFDMLTFVSPDASFLAGSTPWETTETGTASDIKNVKIFRVPESPAYTQTGPGNLQQINCSSVSLSYSPSTSETSSGTISTLPTAARNITGTLSSEYLSGEVSVSDFTVDVEFLDIEAAASDLGITASDVSTSPVIVGNHLVDHLLKTHIRNVSGLDLGDAAYTTADVAFELSTGDLERDRSYVFDLCTVNFLTGKQAGTADFESSVRHLDVLSRTPIMRSGNYASLCQNATYFDRVFAFPINMLQFVEATDETASRVTPAQTTPAGRTSAATLAGNPDWANGLGEKLYGS